MAAGYSYSGVTKLSSPSWLDGTAVQKVLNCPLSIDGPLRQALLSCPAEVLELATYAILLCEICFLPLALVSLARPLIWTTMLTMHITLIALIDFADLSAAMILLHAMTLDPSWLRRRDPDREPS